MSEPVLFSETQRLRNQPLILIAVIGLTGAARSSGGRIGAAAIAVIAGVVAVGLLAVRLETSVSPGYLTVRFWPFPSRRIEVGRITGVRASTFRPFRDFGGRGFRIVPGRRAYVMSGTGGVEVALAAGPSIVIGSQNPEELAQALMAAGAPKVS